MKRKGVWSAWVMFLLVLASCGPQGRETPTATPALAATSPALSPTPTATATPTPTATVLAEPPTPTPTETAIGGGLAPTASPLPTAVPLCADYELEIEVRVSQSYEGFWAEFGGKGRIPLTADLSQDPPRLKGSGEVPISGSGMAGECALVYSGSFVYTISGEILRNEQGNRMVHLVGQTEGAITATSPNCEAGGGGGVPAPEQWEMEMPYEDGATETRTVTAPGTTAEGTWTLDILCTGS